MEGPMARAAAYAASASYATGYGSPPPAPPPPSVASAKKTVLSDRFLLGEELGRGAYGQVYKSIDYTTGNTVAIKQISLSGMSQDNLQSVMGEIDLLKTLNHKNIVQYFGSFKTRTHLYIILEFMENGALSSVIKPQSFGVFQEPLASVFVAQVLQGLQYLHEQGVVHRDIKGANILTTKEGLVKLADFGVAAKLGELEQHKADELHQNVVGTPYWMAPEVIEMTQVTSASDIWSVGCLVIELITGNPPYHDLQPMSALFRIVQDDHPTLPESASPFLFDFLMQCFQKDPKARPTAKQLLRHEWIQVNQRDLALTYRKTQGFRNKGARTNDAHENVDSVVQRILGANNLAVGGDQGPAVTAAAHFATGPASTSAAAAAAGLTSFTSEASSASRLSMAQIDPLSAPPQQTMTSSASELTMAAASGPLAGQRLAGGGGWDSAMPSLRSVAGGEGGGIGRGGMPSGSSLMHSPSSTVGQSDMVFVNGAMSQRPGKPISEAPLGDFISRLQIDAGIVPAASTSSMLQSGAAVRNDLAAWLDEGGDSGGGGVSGGRSQGHQRAHSASGQGSHLFQAYSSSEIRQMGGMMDAEEMPSGHSEDLKRRVRDLVRQLRPPSPLNMLLRPTQAFGALEALIKTHHEVRQHFITEGGPLVLFELLDSDTHKHIEAAIDLVLLLTADDVRLLEGLCLVGVVPSIARFTQQPWPLTLRLKAAAFVQHLCFSRDSTLQMFIASQGIKVLVGMVADYGPSALGPATAELAQVVGPSLTHCAIAAIWRVLEVYAMVPINYICRLLAQSSLVPRLYVVLKQSVMLQAQKRPNNNPRLQPHLPYGAGLKTPILQQQRLGPPGQPIPLAVARAAAAGASATPRVTEAPAAPLAWLSGPSGPMGQQQYVAPTGNAQPRLSPSPARPTDMLGVDPDEVDWLMERAVTLLLALSRADEVTKSFMCSQNNLQAHLECLQMRLPAMYLVKLMKCLRWLTSEHSMVAAIKEAKAIPELVPFLAKEKEGCGVEVQLEAIHALYNLCKLNKPAQIEAANAGVIAHLCRLTTEHAGHLTMVTSPEAMGQKPIAGSRWLSFRDFLVPMLIHMIPLSSGIRTKLWGSNALDILLQLLSEEDTSIQIVALSAVDTWLAEDHTRVEQKLTTKESVAQLVALYAHSCQIHDAQTTPQLLNSLRSLIGRSSKLAVALAMGGIVPWLLAMIDGAAPIMQIKILDIIRCLYEHYPRPKEFIMVYKISDVLKKLLEVHGRGGDAVVEQTQRLLNAFQINVLL